MGIDNKAVCKWVGRVGRIVCAVYFPKHPPSWNPWFFSIFMVSLGFHDGIPGFYDLYHQDIRDIIISIFTFMVFMGPDDIPDEKCSDSVTATAMGWAAGPKNRQARCWSICWRRRGRYVKGSAHRGDIEKDFLVLSMCLDDWGHNLYN